MSYFVHESSYIDDNVMIGEGTKVWHFSHVQKGAQIGKKCSLGQYVNISNNVKSGKGVKIQNNVSVYEGVELDDYVFCGPSMVFTNDLNPRAAFPKKPGEGYVTTLVKEGVSIGANATIVCGTTIGEWSFIGAGAVITKNVPAYALMAGVPARQLGWICKCGNSIKEKDLYKCNHCGREYNRGSEGLKITKDI